MKQAANCSLEDDAIVLSKAARIIHEDILNSNVAGSFSADYQQQSVPTNVKYFVSMLLNGKFEQPLPLYLGLKIHTQTRSKKLVSEMYHLGISVSYNRILEFENQIAPSLCNFIDEIGLVWPHQQRYSLLVFWTI